VLGGAAVLGGVVVEGAGSVAPEKELPPPPPHPMKPIKAKQTTPARDQSPVLSISQLP